MRSTLLPWAAVTTFSCLLGGCINIPLPGPMAMPPHQDALASLEMEPKAPAFPSLTLAVIESENLQKATAMGYQWSSWAGLDPGQSLKKGFELFRRNFKAAVKIEKVSDARAMNADLIAVFDTKLPTQGAAETEIEYSAIFLDIDKRPIDTLRGKASRPRSTFMKQGALGPAFQAMFSEAFQMLEDAVRASAPLAEFARSRGHEALSAPAARPQAPTSNVDRPTYKVPQDPNAFAVVVGVEKYSNELPDAQFAERDATAVKAHLLALGYPERNIKFLIGQRATKSSLEGYLETWLSRNVDEDSTVFFYYSGHGAPDPVSGQAYLLPVDGNPELLENTGYPTKRLHAKLNALKAKRVIVALDSCFSGAGGRSVLAKGARPLVNKVDLGLEAGKTTTLSASKNNQISGTIEEEGHGAFTYYLLKGLNGSAADRSGHVTVQGLYDYLVPQVRDAASRHNRDQTPQLAPAAEDAEIRLR